MIVVDVMCVVCEVVIVATKCPCTGFDGRRRLGGGGGSGGGGSCAQGEYEFSHEQHSAEVMFHYISVSILFGALNLKRHL